MLQISLVFQMPPCKVIQDTLSTLLNHPLPMTVPVYINLSTPNVNYSGRTAPLTSKFAFYIFIQQI